MHPTDAVIPLIARGASVRDATDRLGISRTAVRWRAKRDAAFAARLRDAQQNPVAAAQRTLGIALATTETDR
jgi:hypothetical protein